MMLHELTVLFVDVIQKIVLCPPPEMSAHAAGPLWRDTALVTSERRILDPQDLQPQLAPLAAGTLYCTYGGLRRFMLIEIERLAPDHVHFHSHHRLMVRWPCISTLVPIAYHLASTVLCWISQRDARQAQVFGVYVG
jgi:hypothetical protein